MPRSLLPPKRRQTNRASFAERDGNNSTTCVRGKKSISQKSLREWVHHCEREREKKKECVPARQSESSTKAASDGDWHLSQSNGNYCNCSVLLFVFIHNTKVVRRRLRFLSQFSRALSLSGFRSRQLHAKRRIRVTTHDGAACCHRCLKLPLLVLKHLPCASVVPSVCALFPKYLSRVFLYWPAGWLAAWHISLCSF